ncbi:helix-turn-helix domain-containing protein, partial [Euryarchaeota archaeon]|nr:helix-turn-helix domain-containing protein [Euryarchaeota archaeon]
LTELKENLADVLTEKQLEIAVLAVNSGYYNQPREISKKELSEITGIPRSTLQEHLAKAEATLVKHAVQSHLSK